MPDSVHRAIEELRRQLAIVHRVIFELEQLESAEAWSPQEGTNAEDSPQQASKTAGPVAPRIR